MNMQKLPIPRCPLMRTTFCRKAEGSKSALRAQGGETYQPLSEFGSLKKQSKNSCK